MDTRKKDSKKQGGWICFVLPALILLGSLFVFVSCGKEDISVVKPEKVVVMFGVDSGEGGLLVKVDDREIISPAEIEKGKTVAFTAIHSKSWSIKYWKINGVIIRSVDHEQKFTADKHLDVRVAFKPYIVPVSEHE